MNVTHLLKRDKENNPITLWSIDTSIEPHEFTCIKNTPRGLSIEHLKGTLFIDKDFLTLNIRTLNFSDYVIQLKNSEYEKTD